MGATDRKRVIDQLEYYFSDVNLMNDHFMRRVAHKNNGCKTSHSIASHLPFMAFNDISSPTGLPMKTLMRFRRLNALVNNSMDVLTDAVKNSSSDLIETNDTIDGIRRKPCKPLPQMSDQLMASVDERTVYAKGFPKEATVAELIQWAQRFDGFVSLQIGRHRSGRRFSGSLFMTFTDKCLADKMRNQLGVKYNDNELQMETKLEYNFRTKAFINVQKLKSQPKTNGVSNGLSAKDLIPDKSVVIKIMGLKRSVSTDRLKKFFTPYGKVVYCGRHPDGHCLVQFANSLDTLNGLSAIMAPTNGGIDPKMVINGQEVSAQVLSGDEEKQFWIVANHKKSVRSKRREKLNHKKDRKRTASQTGDQSAKRLAQN
ncbi:unnamed protein product [Oppiella nova]|uniref:Uncharacterized protein n=1 Tax=Oppiella nova TaxID=334625 RepID=A0A7R9LDE2_9ACAR|nr:unnamed protein product [Oppiella nova]CAG2162432.1 unnamed protein product [Oppiella nova]